MSSGNSKNIEEIKQNIDKPSKTLTVSNIELLFNYGIHYCDLQ